jgi:protein-S-isoprenylcysteine O-methyltransferase Ste14
MIEPMDRLTLRAYGGLAFLAVVMALLLFVSAGRLSYFKGWAFWGLFVGAALAITVYLMRSDRGLLERRVAAGPVAEQRTAQRVIQSFASLTFIALLVVPGLDCRFGWSHVPALVAALGDALVVASFAGILVVFRENGYTAATIAVARGQAVVTTGPYRFVRHPMYAAALMLFLAAPLALGSWWALLLVIPLAAVLVARVLDEERLLVEDLPGYRDYRALTRWRLIPGLW